MLIHNRLFSGERPKKSARNLNTNEAQLALDCAIVSDELRALRTNRFIEAAPIANPLTIFLVDGLWVAFDERVDAITTSLNSSEKRVFWTSETNVPQQATLDQFMFGTSFNAGIQKPIAPEQPVVSGDALDENSTAISSFYVVTFVNAYGEEGDKSDPSPSFDFQLGQTLTVSGLGDITANQSNIDPYNIVALRIYRFDEGSSKFVTELPISSNSYVDNSGTTVLGESFSREDYHAPPSDLKGLHLMANGIAAGFAGTTVYLSEAFLPNAWPYSFEVSSKVIAISSYDNNLVILTEEYPEIASIFDPINVSSAVLTDREPCINPDSVVQGASGVMYAAPSGLYYIGSGGGQMLTENFFDERDWVRYKPETFNSVYRDGQYIAFHESDEVRGNALVFDTRENNSVVTQVSDFTSAPYVIDGTDDLYMVQDGSINLYQGGEDRRVYTWRSKLHGGGSPFNLDCYRLMSCDFQENFTDEERENFEDLVDEIVTENESLFAEWSALPDIWGLGGGINTHVFGGCDVQDISSSLQDQTVGSVFASGQVGGARRLPLDNRNFTVTLDVYRDKVLLDSISVSDDEPGRIEYSDRARLWEYELTGNVDLTQANLAGSMGELHNGS